MADITTSNDDSESVDQFLARIASLKDKRDREDEERTRKLEEEILQGRRERQARRAERARSISPSKASPAASVSSTADSRMMANRPIDPPVDLSPGKAASTPTKSSALKPREQLESPAPSATVISNRPLPTLPRGPGTFMPPPANPSALSGSGSLSWQQRPSSRDSNSSRPRPVSGISATLTTDSVPDGLKSKSMDDFSRSEIAQSLGSKDASWFRQTSDRGLTSAAYRKNQVEVDSADDTYTATRSMRLPGMSRESTAEPERPSTPQSFVDRRAQQISNEPGTDSDYVRSQFSTSTSSEQPSQNAFALPLSKSQKLEPSFGKPAGLRSEPSSEPIRLVPTTAPTSDRPLSPTKGLGGFVQSAMMKRSDSVNKRWSVQQSAGLKRGDSVASNRSTLAAAGAPTLRGLSRSPTRASRPLGGDLPSSPLGSSRPSSSHTDDAFPKPLSRPESQAQTRTLADGGDPTFVERSRAVVNTDKPEKLMQDDTLPVSPTKTMEPRRWSPTKASWLESALTRPDSPKLASPIVDQPSWKTDLQRSKLARTSHEDAPNPISNYDVNPTSLLRSPPPGGHARPLSISGMPEGFSSGTIKKPLAPVPLPKPVITTQSSATKDSQLSKPIQPPTSSKTIGKATSPDINSPPSEAAESSGSGKIRDPPVVKPKPQAPTKTDYRANLKSRQDNPNKDSNAEPEFKAVFGKLKRTQTQNYVAPDELKDNITRGKAGLNVTGGPQKATRVDEFKESILQKKEAMKAAGGSVHSKPESRASTPSEKPTPVLPEALAKRQLLGKSKPSTTISSRSTTDANLPSESLTSISDQTKGPIEKGEAPSPQNTANEDANAAVFDRSLVGPQSNSKGTFSKPTSVAPKSSGIQTKAPETSQIAARINPALAGFLSRSSSPHQRSNNGVSKEASSKASATPSIDHSGLADDSTNLTHMTKARAKGPKRRLPKSEPTPVSVTTNSSASQIVEHPRISRPLPTKLEPANSSDAHNTPKPGDLASKSQDGQFLTESVQKLMSTPDLSRPVVGSFVPKEAVTIVPATRVSQPSKSEAITMPQKSKPQVASKSPELRKVSSPPVAKPKDTTLSGKIASSQKFSIAADDASAVDLGRPKSVPQVTPSKSENLGIMPLTPSTTKANSSRISRVDGTESPPKPSTSRPLPKAKGLGLNFDRSPTTPKASVVAPEPTPPPEKSLNEDSQGRVSLCLQALTEFFDQRPRFSDKAEFNTEQLLSASAEDCEKIKTISMQIWEINGDGKQQSMPPQQEHILFEECMYLLTHSYQNPTGTKSSEVYLWSGDGVADAAVEDAQLFCRKIARENGGKLEVVKQGKEPSRFFQALGGIVITRRTKSSALYMLCGRRHLGHVAFDEVDFDLSSLCSGFPYIVSARFGKLYLWKGSGSAADELGCARLMGMDLCLTGEMEEIKEGEEPAAFFDSFPNTNIGTRKPFSEQWQVKDAHPKYGCKLYRVEHDRPKSAGFWTRRASSPSHSPSKALVTEISPFCQRDLESGHIYILDSYFEIYVFAGEQAKSKYAEFTTASILAQEMSYLAPDPSILDRPVLSVCRATLGEPPIDFTLNFRKWQAPRNSPSPKVFDLNTVEETLR